MVHGKSWMSGKYLLFMLVSGVIYVLYYFNVNMLLTSPFTTEYYSHILLIPLLSAYLLYRKRQFLESSQEGSYESGLALLVAGIIIYAVKTINDDVFTTNEALVLLACSALTSWGGGFVFIYGVKAVRIAVVPFIFLVFMFPVPTTVMDKVIYFLQSGSSTTVEGFFTLTGVPFTRDGFVFHLPTLSVEVAKQCSGIRSTLALIITGVLAAQLLLTKNWQKIIFMMSLIPVALFKNGLRITVLSILGVYWDERILVDGWLHRSGGIVFFIIALCLLSLILMLLRSTEKFIAADRTKVRHAPTVG